MGRSRGKSRRLGMSLLSLCSGGEQLRQGVDGHRPSTSSGDSEASGVGLIGILAALVSVSFLQGKLEDFEKSSRWS